MQFSPGIYEHAAALIKRSPWEVSRSAELLIEAHRAAWERYRQPLVVVGIDVYNLEAEAYGATITKPNGNNIPNISRHPCAEIDELLDLAPMDPRAHERISAVLEAGRQLKSACPGAEIRIPVCGPFSLASGLLGFEELLMGLVEDREILSAALRHLTNGQEAYLQAIAEAGLLPVIFESGTTPPLLPAKDFREIEAPLLTSLFARAKAIFGTPQPSIIGGDALAVARELLATGPSFVIAPSETDQAAFMKACAGHPEIHVRVNMVPSALLSADLTVVEAEAQRCYELATSRPNSSVGCGVVPYEADPEIICHCRDFIETAR